MNTHLIYAITYVLSPLLSIHLGDFYQPLTHQNNIGNCKPFPILKLSQYISKFNDNIIDINASLVNCNFLDNSHKSLANTAN